MRITKSLALSLLLFCTVTASVRAQTYRVTDLGTLGGATSYPSDINIFGDVAGYSFPSGSDGYHAFLWTSHGGMQDLGTLGGDASFTYGLNNRGQAVGYSVLASAQGSDGFISTKDGGMRALGVLDFFTDCNYATAWSINDWGQVVGAANQSPGIVAHAFLWSRAHGFEDLGSVGGSRSVAFSINNLGQVVGTSTTAGELSQHDFLWSRETGIQDVGTLGAGSIPTQINNRGEFVGSFTTSLGPSQSQHAYIWTAASGHVDLGTLSGSDSGAFGINDFNQVVGSSRLADNVTQHAFLWTAKTGMQDLNGHIDRHSHWVVQGGQAINNVGQIAAWGAKDGGPVHALLLTPYNEREKEHSEKDER